MLRRSILLSLAVGLSRGAVTIDDPSDFQDLRADAADNTILGIWNIMPVMYQESSIKGPFIYSDTDKELVHELFTVNANDTSVIVVTEDSKVNISDSTVIKHGYASNLYQSSFYGINAAVNVANGSTAYLENVNITTHNGAANVYSYGTGTYAYVEDSSLYSSGPVAHGLYASGNGTIIGRNVQHYSGGNRASSFAGDSPAGYVYVYDSVAHTAGVGSGIFYAMGSIYAENVVGIAEQSPTMFMDGFQTANLINVDLTAGLLGGIVIFSSSAREEGASINFTNSALTVLPKTAPALWYGNIIADTRIINTKLNTASGILVVANYSQVTQDFDYYAGYADNSGLSPAEVTITVEESTLKGDLVAYNSSSISWSLTDYSSWTGAAYSGYKTGYFAVSLDQTSTWTLTQDTHLTNFTDADKTLSNVISAGHSIYYDKTSSANSWLNGRTIRLNGGGKLTPDS